MLEIAWNPVWHVGPIPINWYGLGWAAAFLTGAALLRRWAPRAGVPLAELERLLVWILIGAFAGARVYFIVQNQPGAYLSEPWRIFAVWDGGLALFGGLLCATLAGFLYTRRHQLSFARVADLCAPAIPIAAAIGRIPCGLAGMDYGTPTSAPWGIVYTHPASFAPVDGVPRHPVQFYELVGDLLIAGLLLKLRGKVAEGTLFLSYLVLFSALRFVLFFFRGDVPMVGLGLTNGHWTALAILVAAVAWRGRRRGVRYA